MKRNIAFMVVVTLAVSLSAATAYATATTDAAAAVLDSGIEMIEAQDYTGALAYFDAAIATNGDIAAFHYYRGMALSRLYQYEEAEKAYARAVEIEPENARYLDDYGMSMTSYSERFEEAYEWVDKAVSLEPLNGEYIADRGFVLYLLYRDDEALADLERAIELSPDYDNAYYFAALIQYGRGAFAEAARYCEEYLARVPIADEMRVLLGDALFEQGNYAEALAAYNQVISESNITAEDIIHYAAAKEQAEKPPLLLTYSVDKETIPSIDSVVGFRMIMNTEAGFSISQGGSFVKVNYQSASVPADLQAYVNALIDSGWAVIVPENETAAGAIQLAAESTQGGKLLTVTCEFGEGAYSILAQRVNGTLQRYTDDDGNPMGEILPN